ncbi:MAG TPA: hypothetical protein VMR89_04690 [Actinomycetota bacterium]|nr:hypothetical protein [Actinomycetota bacterium]
MEDERFTVEQVAALKAAIYPFVEAYRTPMNPEDVELLAIAVLGATSDRSRMRQAMRRDPRREQSG